MHRCYGRIASGAHGTDRLRDWRRPGQTRSGRKSCPAGRQCDRRQFFLHELVAKRLGLLHDLVPKAVRVAVLVNPANAQSPRPRYETYRKLHAPSDCKFRSSTPAPAARSRRPSPPSCATGPMLCSSLATCSSPAGASNLRRLRRTTIPAAYAFREAVEAGGLMSYGDRSCGHVSSGRRLHRSNPQGREARRPAGLAVDQIRVRHQPANGQGARPRGAGEATRSCRRGDRMNWRLFAAVHEFGMARTGRS